MSLPSLVGGADCGPVNPLAQLTKRLGGDGGAAGGSQWDRQVGPSGSNQLQPGSDFRSRGSKLNEKSGNDFTQEDFLRNQQRAAAISANRDAFDLSNLQLNLPFAPSIGPQGNHLESLPHLNQQAQFNHHHQMEAAFRQPNQSSSPSLAQQQHSQPNNTQSGWANAFLNKNQASNSVSQNHSPQRMDSPSFNQTGMMNRGAGMGMGMGTGMMSGMGMNHQMNLMNSQPGMYSQFNGGSMGMDIDFREGTRMEDRTDFKEDTSNWETAFAAHEHRSASPARTSSHSHNQNLENRSTLNESLQEPVTSPQDADDLARTAGELISNVSHETNSKFAQSNFLELMRKLRDREAGIKGADIVPTEAGHSSFSTAEKGKGKERDTSDFKRPQNQQEAYRWAQEMAAKGQSSVLPPSLQNSLGNSSLSRDRGMNTLNPSSTLSAEVDGRNMLNDLWAEEDARSEAIEKAARERAQKSFVGDAGDVASRMREDDAEAREFERYRGLEAGVLGAKSGSWEEDFDQAAAIEQADEMENQDFVGRGWERGKGRGRNGWQQGEWDKLQGDWDQWTAGPSGMSRNETRQERLSTPPISASTAPTYRFIEENPYRLASTNGTSTTHHHSHHSNVATSSQHSALDSVLEREAAVQADPTNASAWLSLGLKQQENEREAMAIAALHKALELDPGCKEAWLGLAVSYTNENQRESAMESIERWIDSSEKYVGIVASHRVNNPPLVNSSGLAQRHKEITDTLIAIARHSASLAANGQEMDADVQVALGVLFNASEEYDKAVDCFSAALSVRPDDWLLYNRLGATLSNSGRSDEAIGYYGRALELQPGFVRAHFNACVAYMNLKLYNEAATHIFTALHLQQSEVEVEGAHLDSSQIDSSLSNGSLWETFRVALELLNRPDLADLTASKNVNLFDPSDFAT